MHVKSLHIYLRHAPCRRGVRREGVMGVSEHPLQLRYSVVFHYNMQFRILKMIATSGFLTALVLWSPPIFVFGRPAGNLIALPRALILVKGVTLLRGGERKLRDKGREGRGKRREKKG